MASPNSFRDPYWSNLASKAEQKYDLTPGLLVSVLTNGERSNADQKSEAGASTVFQIIPKTREQFLKRDGIDAYLNDQNAADVAALTLKDGVNWAKGRAKSPIEADALAAGYYHAGGDTANWGPKTQAYMNRVGVGIQKTKVDSLSSGFASFMANNPAVPAAAATPSAAPEKNDLAAGFGNWLAQQEAPKGPEAIPGQAPGVAPAPDGSIPQAGQPDPGIGGTLLGTGEAALNVATGMTGGAVGMAAGAVGGIAKSILDGSFGTPEAMKMVEQSAAGGAQALTYAPRTASGQAQAGAVGEAMGQALPVMPLGAEMAGLSRAASLARPGGASIPSVARSAAAPVTEALSGITAPIQAAVAPAMARAGQAAAGVPGRVAQVFSRGEQAKPTPGTMGSMGAAGTDMATVRRMQADELPVPMTLTKGQAERSFEQQRFEQETAKSPELGASLRDKFADQNQNVLRNFDAMIDMTGAEAPTLRAAGVAVDKALVAKATRDKTEVKVKYAAAKRSPEARVAVDQEMPVSIGEGESALTSTPLAYINEQPTGLPSSAVPDAARQYAVRMGIADLKDGQLIPRAGATISKMEDWRAAVNSVTGFEPVDIRHATILKKLIDGQTEPLAGPLYRDARNARARYAVQYENRAVINDLLSNKRGTQDRKVAFEDVFDRAILRGSLDDVRTVRKVLQTSDVEGKQAWKELQGQTVNYIKEQATRNVATDIRGNKIVSAAGMDKAIKALDADGKLDFIFGKKGAEQLRALNDLAKYIYTAPPGSVNTSNTASVILAAMDMVISGAGGMPLPITTGLRMVVNNVKDRRVRLRVNAALQAPGAPKKPTIH